MTSFPMEDTKNVINVAKKAFLTEDLSPEQMITTMVGFATKARREGLLGLEEETEAIENDFLKKGLQLVVDGQVLTESAAIALYIADRHPEAKLAPAPGELARSEAERARHRRGIPTRTISGLISFLTRPSRGCTANPGLVSRRGKFQRGMTLIPRPRRW